MPLVATSEICENCNQITFFPAEKGIYTLCDHCNDTLGVCSECGELHPKTDSVGHDGSIYCPACFDRFFDTCSDCEEVFRKDDLNSHGRELYCSSCENEYRYCDMCGDWESIDDITTINGDDVCNHCRNNHFFECYSCDEYHHIDGCYSSDITGESYCQSCYYNIFDRCGDCGSEYFRGEGCENCSGGIIMDYSEKPSPVFYNKKDTGFNNNTRYYGLELEVEGDGRDDSIQMAEQIENDPFYFKWDGSVDDGFEIITHPMSWEYIKNKEGLFKNTLQKLRSNGFNSHNTSTCGIHIHVNKNSLSRCDIFKLMKFFKDNQKFILKISQRKIENLKRWASIDDDNKSIVYKAKSKVDDNCRRYTALNLTYKTLEFRIFRGNLKYERLMKNLEFVKAICEFVHEVSMMDMTKAKFVRFVSDNRKTFPNLYTFIDHIEND